MQANKQTNKQRWSDKQHMAGTFKEQTKRVPSTGCDSRCSYSASNTTRAQGINENQHHICVEGWIRPAAASRLFLTLLLLLRLSVSLPHCIHSFLQSSPTPSLTLPLPAPFTISCPPVHELSCVSTRAEGVGRCNSRGERKRKSGGEVEGDGQGD